MTTHSHRNEIREHIIRAAQIPPKPVARVTVPVDENLYAKMLKDHNATLAQCKALRRRVVSVNSFVRHAISDGRWRTLEETHKLVKKSFTKITVSRSLHAMLSDKTVLRDEKGGKILWRLA